MKNRTKFVRVQKYNLHKHSNVNKCGTSGLRFRTKIKTEVLLLFTFKCLCNLHFWSRTIFFQFLTKRKNQKNENLVFFSLSLYRKKRSIWTFFNYFFLLKICKKSSEFKNIHFIDIEPQIAEIKCRVKWTPPSNVRGGNR